LRKRTDFAQLKAQGKRLRGKALSCNWDLQADAFRKAAFIVPKSCGEAVVRNRIKRRLRELYRLSQHDFPPALRSVWIAHPSSAKLSYAEIRSDFVQVCRRAGLLSQPGSLPPA
jgi:ribonuclease P protein component